MEQDGDQSQSRPRAAASASPTDVEELRSRMSAARSGSFTRLLPSPHLSPRDGGKGSPLRLEFGIWSIQGRRKTQEDAHSAVPSLLEEESEAEEDAQRPFAFFGVFDGHGGEKASEWVGQHFDKILSDRITQNGDQPSSSADALSRALREAFLQVEAQWMEIANEKKECSGTTAAVVVVKDNDLIVGNVGDTEVVLALEEGEKLKAEAITEVHNPKKNKAEGERVVKEGGIIHRDRVGHPQFNPDLMSIAISRAIGDYGFKAKEFTGGKNSGLTAEPHVTGLTLQPEKHKFCIIACDGLWDVITAEEAVDFIAHQQKAEKNAEEAAKALVEAAYKKGSTDNITVLVIYFCWNPQQQQQQQQQA